MGLLKERDRRNLINLFKNIERDVKIVMFTQEIECQPCETTRMMVEEISGLSEKLSLVVRDFVGDAESAKRYGVDKIPAVLLEGDRDYGIRFYGVPSGYEFRVLVEDIMDVGRRSPGLNEEVLNELAKVDQPVHLQVLISPT